MHCGSEINRAEAPCPWWPPIWERWRPVLCDLLSQTQRYAYGSGTKPVTSVLIHQLAAQGHFSLDDAAAPLVRPLMHAMSGGQVNMSTLWPDPRHADVTVRQLLHHRSGIQELSNVQLRQWTNANPTARFCAAASRAPCRRTADGRTERKGWRRSS